MNWVTLEIRGSTGVKFMNICAHRNIPVKGVKRQADDLYTVEIPAKAYKKQGRQIARKVGCKVHLVKRTGIGMTLFRYRKRRVLWIGLPLCIFLVFYFNSVIWQIEITGGDGQDRTITRSLLTENGIRPGSFFTSFDNRELADILLAGQQDKLCWVGVHRVGTVLQIELAQGTFYTGDPDIPLDEPCDITSSKEGVVTKVLTTAGTTLVKPGDVVQQGQMLISGTVTLDDEIITGRPLVKTHAIGEIYAVVTYTESVPVENSVVKTVQTGNTDKEYVLYLPGFSVKLPFLTGTDFAQYSTIYKDSFVRGPFGIGEITYIETVSSEVELSEEEAAAYAKEKATSVLNEEIPEGAVILETSVTIADGYAVATAQCVENIAISVPAVM